MPVKYTETQKNSMKDRLKKIASKKIDTTMIFPLSQFEADFGHLWGHGLDDQDLSNDQKIYKKKWEHCRDQVLDNGNKQKRGLSKEIDMHDIVWKRYVTEFKPVRSTI